MVQFIHKFNRLRSLIVTWSTHKSLCMIIIIQPFFRLFSMTLLMMPMLTTERELVWIQLFQKFKFSKGFFKTLLFLLMLQMDGFMEDSMLRVMFMLWKRRENFSKREILMKRPNLIKFNSFSSETWKQKYKKKLKGYIFKI